MTMTDKRSYNRRSDDERIAELQAKIQALQGKLEAKQREDLPVLREIPKVQRRLRKFAQLAVNHGRHDLANSTLAFLAGLERNLNDDEPMRRRRGDGLDEG
jgi:molecular chaperone GrpE (heat shock protein)